MKLEIRTSTAQDIELATGERPQHTVRSWSGYVNNELVGIGGFMLTGTPDHLWWQVFSKIIDRQSLPKTLIWRGALFLMARAAELKSPVYAIADCEIPGARRFLERLGFVWSTDQSGMEIFVWR